MMFFEITVPMMSRLFGLLGFLAMFSIVVVLVAGFVVRSKGFTETTLIGGLASDLRRGGLWIAAAISGTAMLGSLYYSEIANYVPCKLCWIQRICMYPFFILLLIAAIRKDREIWKYAWPFSFVGIGVSIYHSWIQAFPPSNGTSFCTLDAPCTQRHVWEFGFMSIPFLACIAFISVTSYVIFSCLIPRKE